MGKSVSLLAKIHHKVRLASLNAWQFSKSYGSKKGIVDVKVIGIVVDIGDKIEVPEFSIYNTPNYSTRGTNWEIIQL